MHLFLFLNFPFSSFFFAAVILLEDAGDNFSPALTDRGQNTDNTNGLCVFLLITVTQQDVHGNSFGFLCLAHLGRSYQKTAKDFSGRFPSFFAFLLLEKKMFLAF